MLFSQTDIITDALTSFDAFTADGAPRDLLNSAKNTTKSRKNKLASSSRMPQPMTPPDYMKLLVQERANGSTLCPREI